MGETRKSSKFIKECIVDTLFKLLEKKPYEDVKIYEICENAYVGKTSFYRYFNSKDDVLGYAFANMWDEWCDSHNVLVRDRFSLDNAETFFSYNYSIKDKLDLMYKNGLDILLFKSFDDAFKNNKIQDDYEVSFFAYGLCGIVKEWWINNFKETPVELSKILRDFYYDKK